MTTSAQENLLSILMRGPWDAEIAVADDKIFKCQYIILDQIPYFVKAMKFREGTPLEHERPIKFNLSNFSLEIVFEYFARVYGVYGNSISKLKLPQLHDLLILCDFLDYSPIKKDIVTSYLYDRSSEELVSIANYANSTGEMEVCGKYYISALAYKITTGKMPPKTYSSLEDDVKCSVLDAIVNVTNKK